MSLINSILKDCRNVLMKRWKSENWMFTCVKNSSLWTPDYFILAKSKYPEYATTNIQIKGYDYTVLESFQSKIHRLANKMRLEVTDAWSQELQKLKVVRFKAKSDFPESEDILKVYERNVQVSNVYCHQMALFIDLVSTMCPPGVKVSVHPHDPAYDENRYVPENKILLLKEQLKEFEKN